MVAAEATCPPVTLPGARWLRYCRSMIITSDKEVAAPPVRRRAAARATAAGTWAFVAAVGAAAFVVQLRAAQPSAGPVIVADEFGYLGSARYLARAGNSLDAGGTPFYSPGFGVLAAIPARLFDGDPLATYRWTLVLNAGLTAAALIAAALLAARVMRVAVALTATGAFVAALLPSIVFNSTVGLAEPLLTLLVPLSIGSVGVVAADVGSSQGVRRALCVASGVVIGWLPVSHNRLVPVAALLGVAIAVNLIARRESVRLVLFSVTAIVMAVAWRGLAWLTRRAVWRDNDDEAHEAAMRRAVSSPRGLWQTAQVLVGQSWALVVGTAGFAALAVIALARVSLAAPVAGRTAAGPWVGSLVRSPRRLTSAAALAALFVELGVSATFMAGGFVTDGGLPDMFVYGRYVDIFAPLLVVVGVAAAAAMLWRLADTALRRVDVIGCFAALLTLGWAADAVSDNEFAQGWFSPFSAMNVAVYGTDIERGTWATAAAMVTTTVIGAIGWVATERWSHRALRVVALLALLVPAAHALQSRRHDSWWLVDKLRNDGQYARVMGERLTALEPAEVWFDSSVALGDRLIVEWWTPTVRTERASAGCPVGARDGALLLYSSGEPRPREVAREGGLGAAPCG